MAVGKEMEGGGHFWKVPIEIRRKLSHPGICTRVIFLTPCSRVKYILPIFQQSFQYQSLMVGRRNLAHEDNSGQMICQRLVLRVNGTCLWIFLTDVVHGLIRSTRPKSGASKWLNKYLCQWVIPNKGMRGGEVYSAVLRLLDDIFCAKYQEYIYSIGSIIWSRV